MIFREANELVYTPKPGSVVGVMLTGMDSVGARGLKRRRDERHFTIAQDEATAAVYGRPKPAAAVNAAMERLPLVKIGPRLKNMFVRRP